MTRLMLLVGILAILASFQVLYAQEMTASRAQKCRNSVIRKEWRTLADSEKSEWLGAVKCLAGIRHQRLSLTPVQTILDGKRSLYDDFSYSHALAAYSAHDNAYFLPWHRWFVHLFDTSMRETCRYTGPTPYWDWTRDHADLFNSPVFDASPEHGLGGTGICQSSFSGEADCTVATGALASSLGNFELAWPVAHGLRRNLTLFTGWFPHEKPLNTTLTPGFIRDATEKTTGDFFAFQQELTESHNAVHNFVGADLAGVCPNSMPSDDCNGMTQAFTPNDPLFWLHHAQLDRLWDKWQHHHPLNFAAFSGRFLDAQDPQGPHHDPEADVDHHMLFDIHSVPMTPAMLLDIEAWPLCYQYVDE